MRIEEWTYYYYVAPDLEPNKIMKIMILVVPTRENREMENTAEISG